MRKVQLGEQVDHLAYSSPSDTYIVGTSCKTGFKLPENDELHLEWRNEGWFQLNISGEHVLTSSVISFLPEIEQSSVKVISPKTWTVIDEYGPKPNRK